MHNQVKKRKPLSRHIALRKCSTEAARWSRACSKWQHEQQQARQPTWHGKKRIHLFEQRVGKVSQDVAPLVAHAQVAAQTQTSQTTLRRKSETEQSRQGSAFWGTEGRAVAGAREQARSRSDGRAGRTQTTAEHASLQAGQTPATRDRRGEDRPAIHRPGDEPLDGLLHHVAREFGHSLLHQILIAPTAYK